MLLCINLDYNFADVRSHVVDHYVDLSEAALLPCFLSVCALVLLILMAHLAAVVNRFLIISVSFPFPLYLGLS